jgi:MFS family permease
MSQSDIIDEPVPRGTFAALSNPNYRKFLVGQGISLTGSWLQAAAVSWIVFDRTKSERMSGLVEAAAIVPGLLVGVLAGAFADRFVPRTVIMLSQLVQMILAFILAALVVTGNERIWILALIVALTRIFVTFEMPSRQVFIYDVVGRPMMMNAIALNTGLFNASRVFGPALAGICLYRLGESACFGLNGASYFAAIASLLMIKIPARIHPKAAPTKKDLWGGFAYLMHDHRLRSHYLVMTGFGVLGGGFNALGPSYAQRWIGTGTGGFSLLLAMGGIGATLGALVVASFSRTERRDRFVLAGIFGFAASMSAAIWVPPWFGGFGSSARLIVGSLFMMGTGVGAIVFFAATQTTIQVAVPETLRGRIMGIWMIVYSGSVPLGCLWAGELAQAIGVDIAMNLAAGLTASLGLVAGLTGMLRERPVISGPPARL